MPKHGHNFLLVKVLYILFVPTLFLINILIIRLYFGYVLANWITK